MMPVNPIFDRLRRAIELSGNLGDRPVMKENLLNGPAFERGIITK